MFQIQEISIRMVECRKNSTAYKGLVCMEARVGPFCLALQAPSALISVDFIFYPGWFFAFPDSVVAQLVDIIGNKSTFHASQRHKTTLWSIDGHVVIVSRELIRSLFSTTDAERSILYVRSGAGKISFGLASNDVIYLQTGAFRLPFRRPPGGVFLLADLCLFPSPEQGGKKPKLLIIFLSSTGACHSSFGRD